jgi:Rps23 Pro-64 3,4-dihydroxylase Tpa1-like proline 4-hydroxylase
MTKIIDYKKLRARLMKDQLSFEKASPFPYIVIDDFLSPNAALDLLTEFKVLSQDGDPWSQYNHYNERKTGLTDRSVMGAHVKQVIDELSSAQFLNWLISLSSINDLIPDPELDGGGLHEIKRNGFLNIHTDFQSHTKRRNWRRELNLLLYLNQNWRDEWQGKLEFWDQDMKARKVEISPIFNRCVIFRTSGQSFHGHPTPLACPQNESRKSLALYFFSDSGAPLNLSSTFYRARPNDKFLKHVLVAADRWLLRGYSYLKRYTFVNDRLVSRLTRRNKD